MRYIILTITVFWTILSGKSGSNISVEATGQEKIRYVYVGAEACASKCHNNEEMGHQLDLWKSSRHSSSWQSLKTRKAHTYAKKAGISVKPWESLVCLQCHVTAAGLDTISLAKTYKIEDGVTCEACHKGEFIPKTFLPKEADCLKCHNDSVHEVSAFDFNKRCLAISHPRPKI